MGHIGERIKQLRVARGWSLEDLAAAMGGLVTRQALWKYEQDKAQPSRAVLNRLATTLGVKAAWFYEEPTTKVQPIAYRKKSGLLVRERERVENVVKGALEDRVRLQELTGITVEPLPVGAYIVSSVEAAEGAAQSLRNDWKLGVDALCSVISVLEDHAIHVIEIDAPEKFDGLSAVAHDAAQTPVAAAVVSRRGVPGERQRFNITHELGHLTMKISPGVDEEKAAHRFSGAFLAPAEVVRREVGEKRTALRWDELLLLKRHLGLSVQALIRRFYDLEIISHELYTEWFKMISMAGMRKQEPEPLPPERPEWLRRTVLRAVAEGLLTREEAQRMIGEPVPDGNTSPHQMSRRAFMRLPREERGRLLEESATRSVRFYEEDTSWREWGGGDFEGIQDPDVLVQDEQQNS